MTPTVLFALPGNTALADSLAAQLDAEAGTLFTRKFPDGETYLRFGTDIQGKSIALVCTLSDPDTKLVPLLLAAQGARQLGAACVGLVAPYLAYMRQDARFQPGEAITSRAVAAMLSQAFDWLATVDPHLHRYRALSDIYSIPACVTHAAPAISAWIGANIPKPFLIGPDEESAQWVSETAKDIKAPYTTLKKHRQADRAVALEPIDIAAIGNRTPVLMDDIIASGGTMIKAVKMLTAARVAPAVCIAVHGLFADCSDRRLREMGVEITTTNTVPNATTHIYLDDLIADGILALRGGN
ncbi:MAG: ribose-phosphate diphosphokinase [Proteobacteria bacterium]|nr:ribose-phosphate diphosphokinase [Pseudomonadota bacterium]